MCSGVSQKIGLLFFPETFFFLNLRFATGEKKTVAWIVKTFGRAKNKRQKKCLTKCP